MTSIPYNMSTSLPVENLFISSLVLTEQLFLYSMSAELNLTQDQEDGATFAIVLIGYADEKIDSDLESFVLVSDPVKYVITENLMQM